MTQIWRISIEMLLNSLCTLWIYIFFLHNSTLCCNVCLQSLFYCTFSAIAISIIIWNKLLWVWFCNYFKEFWVRVSLSLFVCLYTLEALSWSLWYLDLDYCLIEKVHFYKFHVLSMQAWSGNCEIWWRGGNWNWPDLNGISSIWVGSKETQNALILNLIWLKMLKIKTKLEKLRF